MDLAPRSRTQLCLPLFAAADAPPAASKPGDRRTIALAGGEVGYTLRRRQARGLSLLVDERGLTVGAPLAMPMHAIDAFLRDKERWVLRKLAEWSRTALGAEAIILNPLHAVLPLVPQESSPYFPSSRRYRNPLYLRVEEVPGAAEARLDLDRLAAQGRALADERRIDRDAVFRLKMAALETLWAGGERNDEGLTRYRAREGRALDEFATFCVLVERHGAGWKQWPASYRHPASPAVSRFAAEHAERVTFHAWLQWQLDEQLARAGRALRLVTDLAIGFDGEGADAWAWQDVLAQGVTVGAPPDEFAHEGQDWGTPPFIPGRLRAHGYQPFVETVRAGFRHAGGMRIDHVMGLFRLFWVPGGGTARAGAYVRYPTEDLLAILALESERARALVVGEDLGTVAPGVRERLAADDGNAERASCGLRGGLRFDDRYVLRGNAARKPAFRERVAHVAEPDQQYPAH